MFLALGLAFVAGLVTVLSPCVLPVLPFLLGSSIQKYRWSPLILVSGLFLSFSGLGLFVAAAGFQFGLTPEKVRIMAALFLILVGFLMIGSRFQGGLVRLFSGVSANAQRLAGLNQENEHRGQFVVGLLLGAVWAPCAGPTLAAAFGLAITRQDMLAAAIMMMVYSFGAALPLLGIASLSQVTLGRTKSVLRVMGSSGKWVLGSLLILYGVGILFGADMAFDSAFLNLLPDVWVDFIMRF